MKAGVSIKVKGRRAQPPRLAARRFYCYAIPRMAKTPVWSCYFFYGSSSAITQVGDHLILRSAISSRCTARSMSLICREYRGTALSLVHTSACKGIPPADNHVPRTFSAAIANLAHSMASSISFWEAGAPRDRDGRLCGAVTGGAGGIGSGFGAGAGAGADGICCW